MINEGIFIGVFIGIQDHGVASHVQGGPPSSYKWGYNSYK